MKLIIQINALNIPILYLENGKSLGDVSNVLERTMWRPSVRARRCVSTASSTTITEASALRGLRYLGLMLCVQLQRLLVCRKTRVPRLLLLPLLRRPLPSLRRIRREIGC